MTQPIHERADLVERARRAGLALVPQDAAPVEAERETPLVAAERAMADAHAQWQEVEALGVDADHTARAYHAALVAYTALAGPRRDLTPDEARPAVDRDDPDAPAYVPHVIEPRTAATQALLAEWEASHGG